MKQVLMLIVSAAILVLFGCATTQTRDFQRAQSAGIPVLVNSMRTSYPNSAGGVDAHINFVNSSSKTLKYVLFTATPYNRVGDVAPSEIGHKRTARLRATGPYKPGKGNVGLLGDSYWENVWYNNTIRCMEIEGVEVTFMDGTTKTYEGQELSKVLASNLNNSCSAR